MDLFGETPKPKRESWKDFKPNDEDRAYCAERWGLLYLADVFTPEVIEHYTTEGAKRVKNKHLALTRWIQRASPSGRYYNVGYWERQCEQARRYRGAEAGKPVNGEPSNKAVLHQHAGGQESRKPSTWIPASPKGLEALKHIRDILK